MESRKLWKHDLAWGLGLGAAVAASIQILTWLGLGLTHWTWISGWALAAVFGGLAARSLGRRIGERPRLGRAALLVLLMILAARVVEQLYMWIYIQFVEPGWVDRVAEVWTAQLREAGTPEERIARSIADFRNQWRTPYVFTLGIVRYSLPPYIVALLAATVAVVRPWRRRAPREPGAERR